ncbi:MAG: PhoH family protein, partial [Streptococcaceae bacterium]|nr:PhoH family protein [Streptococcaceae bacterium]
PRNAKSGLVDAKDKLSQVASIEFVYFTAKDVVRHPVVAQIIKAYEPKSIKEDVEED